MIGGRHVPDESCFVAEQPGLVIHPSGEPSERAIGTDDPMAGNDDRNRVPAVGGTDGAGLARVAEPPGLLAIADRRRERDPAEHAPRGTLERRAVRIERKIERPPLAGEVFTQLLGRGCEDRGRLGYDRQRSWKYRLRWGATRLKPAA